MTVHTRLRDVRTRLLLAVLAAVTVALAAATVDRTLIRTGGRLGENDTWIAGFAIYYGVPLVSGDDAFDRVVGLRRMSY